MFIISINDIFYKTFSQQKIIYVLNSNEDVNYFQNVHNTLYVNNSSLKLIYILIINKQTNTHTRTYVQLHKYIFIYKVLTQSNFGSSLFFMKFMRNYKADFKHFSVTTLYVYLTTSRQVRIARHVSSRYFLTSFSCFQLIFYYVFKNA